ncbi:hypothetical protein Trydic_g1169 [Trypoxylus dichotomus]
MFIPTSGAPQGSNLSPIFLLVFINDITETLHCQKLLVVDDMKMFYKIDSLDDCLPPQQYLFHIDSCSTYSLQLLLRSRKLAKPSCPEVMLNLSFLRARKTSSAAKRPISDESGFKSLVSRVGAENKEELIRHKI